MKQIRKKEKENNIWEKGVKFVFNQYDKLKFMNVVFEKMCISCTYISNQYCFMENPVCKCAILYVVYRICNK